VREVGNPNFPGWWDGKQKNIYMKDECTINSEGVVLVKGVTSIECEVVTGGSEFITNTADSVVSSTQWRAVVSRKGKLWDSRVSSPVVDKGIKGITATFFLWLWDWGKCGKKGGGKGKGVPERIHEKRRKKKKHRSMT